MMSLMVAVGVGPGRGGVDFTHPALAINRNIARRSATARGGCAMPFICKSPFRVFLIAIASSKTLLH
jgi:hypothetical protein